MINCLFHLLHFNFKLCPSETHFEDDLYTRNFNLNPQTHIRIDKPGG